MPILPEVSSVKLPLCVAVVVESDSELFARVERRVRLARIGPDRDLKRAIRAGKGIGSEIKANTENSLSCHDRNVCDGGTDLCAASESIEQFELHLKTAVGGTTCIGQT